MAFIGPNNALAWAHFRLRGGWKRSLTFSAGAAALLTVLIVGGLRVDPINKARILYGWTTGLLSLGAACLLIYVPGRITASIRQDIQSKLIESHRLMPTPAAEAVAGYIMGAAMQPLVFCGVIFLIGACTASGASVDLSRWTFANLILLGFCGFVWVL